MMFNSVFEGVLVGLILLGVVGTVGLLQPAKPEDTSEPDNGHYDETSNDKALENPEKY